MELETRHKHTARSGRLSPKQQICGLHRMRTIHVGEDGTAEENIALHKAVMTKLAQNGGKVPESMKN